MRKHRRSPLHRQGARPQLEVLEERETPSLTVLNNALGQGETIQLEAHAQLWKTLNGINTLLDNSCRAVAAGVMANGTPAIFHLKSTTDK